jgi:hypothetical protein
MRLENWLEQQWELEDEILCQALQVSRIINASPPHRGRRHASCPGPAVATVAITGLSAMPPAISRVSRCFPVGWRLRGSNKLTEPSLAD